MRDGNNGENFSGTITKIGTTEDGSHDTVTIEVGKHYLKDLNKCNLSDQGGIISLGNREFYYDSWSLERSFDDSGEEVYAYKFVLSDKSKNPEKITNDRVGKLAEIGAEVSYQGIPYYMSQMNEWVRTFSQKFNDILKSGYDSKDRQGTILFTGDLTTDTAQYQFPDETRDDVYTREQYLKDGAARTISVTDDSYYRMTAKNFTILTAMDKDPSLLANRFEVGEGTEKNDLLVALRSMAEGADGTSFRGSSPSEFLQNILSDVALNAQRANTMSKNFKNVSNAIDTRRISISGVDEDEEAVNLVKFQNGSNLASKMIQVLTEIHRFIAG